MAMGSKRGESPSASLPTPSANEASGATETPAALMLPKGGGAIRGIGEKFAANPVTGTGSMTIPIATSPGRSDFGPKLTLSYDSGSGNGPFGLGWTLSLPMVTRKTSQGLPRYQDETESDDFILSNAEDLVPTLRSDGTREVDNTTAPGFIIQRYRPRIDTLYARIERWTRIADGDTHWRSVSSDNILTIYGGDAESRITDPADARRIFSWLICETRDDRGNAIMYRYKSEDGAGADLAKPSERHRGAANDPRRAANRYLKRVLYGNRQPLLDAAGKRPHFLTDLPAAQLADVEWMFEVVLDYGEHDALVPTSAEQTGWRLRFDPFSSYRSTFEVRTARLCRRVLMFHHIPDTPGGDAGYDGVVRSTDFGYLHESQPPDLALPGYAMLSAVTQVGWRRQTGGSYLRRALPPVEFDYTLPDVEERVRNIDPASTENLPVGIDGGRYRWIDLHGEGIPGAFSEQGGGWWYKRNLSPLTPGEVTLAPVECVAARPTLSLRDGAQFLDLAGDGQPDLVTLRSPKGGFQEHDEGEGWTEFRSFPSQLAGNTSGPNARFIDLTGDGTADLLITNSDTLVWIEALGESGFGEARLIGLPMDEDDGPRLVFSDPEETIHLADLSGDGLQDIVRIRNGEICYWPNLGYGRFGAKVTMDNAPRFDRSDQFAPQRIVLADIDGSGTTDIIYLHDDGISLYFNQSGNGWSARRGLNVAPPVDSVAAIAVSDLLGNGTACLVWSSPLAAAERQPIRFVALMGEHKPHLLVKTANNLGAETLVSYAPSTKFYLADRRAGAPWLTRLPFPVHVVERVETIDRIARSRFVTRYAYHHGYFDGVEREFRGFAMVEQWDGELFADGSGAVPAANEDPAFFVPPIHTKSWFHTGAWFGRLAQSDFFAGLFSPAHRNEYYREPGLTDAQAKLQLREDSILPTGLSIEEEREAVRALKGTMLRQEVYAADGSIHAPHPYTVTEQNLRVERAQPKGANRYAVFTTHANEAVSFHYERNPADPRVQHVLTLEVDGFGNVCKHVEVNYPRRQPDASLPLATDRAAQSRVAILYVEKDYSNAIDSATDRLNPLCSDDRTYELTGYAPGGAGGWYTATDFVSQAGGVISHRFDSEIDYAASPSSGRQRRLVEHMRTLFRRDDLSGLLPLGVLEARGLAGETYKLANTEALIATLFVRNGVPLFDPAALLPGGGGSGGGYVRSQTLKADGRFPNSDADDCWWIPSGRSFLSPGSNDNAATELAYALAHFFLPLRTRDPFHSPAASTETLVLYDAHDLLKVESRDALGNRSTVGARRSDGTADPAFAGNDYRVLQPVCLSDANRNRTQIAFDALGLVAGAATLGKLEESLGDSLDGFIADLPEAAIAAQVADPLTGSTALLMRASTRMVYDLFAYHRTRAQPNPEPVTVHTIAREVHDSDGMGSAPTVQYSLSYSDGFGREIQRKVRVEPGPVVEGGPTVSPRWVTSGWMIHNNKGKPVRRFEPFFSASHGFIFGNLIGVSPVLFYDPVGRVIATVLPNESYEKTVFDPWQQQVWDVNDTSLLDPRTDPDVAPYVAAWFADPAQAGWQGWHARRQGGALGPIEQASALKAAAHAGTPTMVHLDAMGRPVLTIVDNGDDPANPGQRLRFASRVELDIEGNERAVRDAIIQSGDARGRIVARYGYDLLGNRVRQESIDAGARWLLNDATGQVLRAWDDRGHEFATEYDVLRRPLSVSVQGTDPADPAATILTDRFVYGEQHPQGEAMNLRGALYLHLDQAGAATTDARDFKANVLRGTRRLTTGTLYRGAIDWTAVDADTTALPADPTQPIDTVALAAALTPILEASGYTSIRAYDALNRVTRITTPHSPSMSPSIVRFGYNEASLLERVEVNLRGASSGGLPIWTPFVVNIDYDAKGQRQRIDYGNGVATTYTHDPVTFRLTRMTTRRDPVLFPGDAPQPSPFGWPGAGLQDLRYSYDPVGNIMHVADDAQQAVFFANRRVEPDAAYVYDALYRLIEATGREHLGQGGTPVPHNHNDATRMQRPQPGDGMAMGSYTENYAYDAVGNILEMRHRGTDPAQPGWTRSYGYAETSRIEDGSGGTALKTGNRLSGTKIGAAPADAYSYDSHGNMLRMPHLGGAGTNMHWDVDDRLRRVDLGGGGVAYNVYDADGQRIRKIWEKSANLTEERIYLGGFEIYRRRQGANLLERETLHVMDDTKRIALIETRTTDSGGTDTAPAQMIRYQLGNHLDSAALELNEAAQIISYEEFTPYGSTAYHAVRSQTETPKRYRFTGKERDEESGFYYHGARYYAPWLGRWASCDPAGLADGLCVYAYARGNPVVLTDPDGLFSKKPFDDWLDAQIKGEKANKESAEKALSGARENLKKGEDAVKQIEKDLKAKTAEKDKNLEERAKITSKKSLTKEDKAKITESKIKNNKLVKEIDNLNTKKNQTIESNEKLKESIKKHERSLDKASGRLSSLTDLKKRFDAAYASATKNSNVSDVHILTDVVMNEARFHGQKTKNSIAYAYMNYPKKHMDGDRVKVPSTTGDGGISYFTAAEGRFTGTEKNEAYIEEVIGALSAAETRLEDTTNKNDPTSGATHWVSPQYLKEKYPPDGIPKWAKSMTKIIVPGIDADKFTFFKK